MVISGKSCLSETIRRDSLAGLKRLQDDIMESVGDVMVEVLHEGRKDFHWQKPVML